METTNQRIALSKRLIKEALLRLLKKMPLAKISISALCKEAQINRTTFYRHYETPDDVLLEIALDFIKQFNRSLSASNETPDEKRFILKLCEFLAENADLIRLFMQNDVGEPYAEEIYQALSASFLGSKTVYYRNKPADGDTLRLINSYFCAGIFALIRRWIIEDIPKSPAEIADLIYSSLNRDFSLQ